MRDKTKKYLIFGGISAAAIIIGITAGILGKKLAGKTSQTVSSQVPSSHVFSQQTSSGKNGNISGTSSIPRIYYKDLNGSESSEYEQNIQNENNGLKKYYNNATVAKDGFTFPKKEKGITYKCNSTLKNPAKLNQEAAVQVDAENVKGIVGSIKATNVIKGNNAKMVMQQYDKKGLYSFISTADACQNIAADFDYAVITLKLTTKTQKGTGTNYTYDLSPYICQSNATDNNWNKNTYNSQMVNYNAACINDTCFKSDGNASVYKVLCLVPKDGNYDLCFDYLEKETPCTVINPNKK